MPKIKIPDAKHITVTFTLREYAVLLDALEIHAGFRGDDRYETLYLALEASFEKTSHTPAKQRIQPYPRRK